MDHCIRLTMGGGGIKVGKSFQMVYDYNRAWHAGAGSWGTLSDLNTYSVGIEVVNWGNEPFPDVQV